MPNTRDWHKPHGPEVVHADGKCAITACRKAHAARQRNRRRMIAYGKWEPLVDAAPVRAHVRRLMDDHGLSVRSICRMSGIPVPTLDKLLYAVAGSQPSQEVTFATAQAILGLTVDLEKIDPKSLVPSLGTQRRIQALHAIGWTLKAIGPIAGLPQASAWKAMGHPKVTADTARAFRRAYDTLWNVDPEDRGTPAWLARRNRASAARNGWAGPLAWNDDTIDDPRAFPDWTGHCGTASGRLLHVAAGGEPCDACAPHMPFVGPVNRGVSRALAKAVPDALLALADAGLTYTDVAGLLGVSGEQIGYAHRLIQQSRMETAA